MQLNKCQFFYFYFFALTQTTYCIHTEVNIDKVDYFCGDRLTGMLSHYCQKYYSRRTKREIATECCKGLGCSIRYAMENYCQEVKPQYKYLFNRAPSETIDSSESQKLPDIIPTKVQPSLPPPDNHSKLIDAIRKSIPEETQISTGNKMDRDSKTPKTNSKQIIDSKPSKPFLSKSYIGTDHVPHGPPVNQKAKLAFLPF
ncbi:uncharacterized protein [Atheta coriaria]|uniref:uncharacterized protein isoform X2 n=1 Tax=Dalotia coriaria TaxID=877792 RepID=UPI0031F4561A